MKKCQEQPESTYKELTEEAREAAVMNEFLPFLVYAAIPIIITIIIAKCFGPQTF